jgi:hypothetical protein
MTELSDDECGFVFNVLGIVIRVHEKMIVARVRSSGGILENSNVDR